MIIVQTPLRVSFLGGGTDFPAFFQEEGGGNVLSSAIDKYIFVTIKQRFDDKIRVGFTRTEIVDSIDELQHELIREALRMTGIERGVEITTMGDIPAGSGLASSSAVTVGALHAMYTYKGETVTAQRLAEEACRIEVEILKKPIGIQDQWICSLGGLRFIEFHPNGSVSDVKLELDNRTRNRLNESLLLFYTGITRKADTILSEQSSNIRSSVDVLNQLKYMACLLRDELAVGNLDVLGTLLHQNWLLKKRLASQVSNSTLDAIYDAALRAGAIGGKITGAGGGGFLLLYCPYDRRESVRDALHSLVEVPFKLERDGTKVIFNYRR